MSIDGLSADIHIGGWDGSVIFSWDGGWYHASVSPYAKRIIPSYDDMCQLKDIFWSEQEDVIHVFPRKDNYVNNVENCLHLWSCTYAPMLLPPSCFVGLRDGQTREEFEREVKEAYGIAEQHKDKIWKDIKGYKGLYQVSNTGKVRSLSHYDLNNIYRESQELKTIKTLDGYMVVNLYKNGKGKQFRIHRLVANAFIPNPNNLPIINHKDENKTNNCVENLEWCGVTYNNNYGTRLNKVAKRLGRPVIAFDLKTSEETFFYSINQAALKTESSTRHISSVIKGDRKTHNGKTWRYATEEEIKAAYEMAGEKY